MQILISLAKKTRDDPFEAGSYSEDMAGVEVKNMIFIYMQYANIHT